MGSFAERCRLEVQETKDQILTGLVPVTQILTKAANAKNGVKPGSSQDHLVMKGVDSQHG